MLVEHVKLKSSLQKTVQQVQSNSGRGKTPRVGETSSSMESQGSFGVGSEEGPSPTEDHFVRPQGAKAAKKKQTTAADQEEIKKLMLESEERFNRAMDTRALQHQEKLSRMDQLI